MSDHIGPAVAAEVARRAQHPYADHPAALVIHDHIAAIGTRAATSRAVCECRCWRGFVCDYPAHLAEMLDQAGLLDGAEARAMLHRVTRALANANRAGHRADIEALVRESWELLGAIPPEVLDRAGLLADPVAVTVEEAAEGDPGMEAVLAWFRNGGRCCGAHHSEGCTDGGPGCCPRCPINPWPAKDQGGTTQGRNT